MKKNPHWPPMTKEDKKLWRMIKELSPEDFLRWQKDIAGIFVNLVSKSKTAEELIEARDSLLVTAPFPPPPIMAAEMKRKFHEKLLEKRRSPFKAIKGGRREKKIRQTLKGSLSCDRYHPPTKGREPMKPLDEQQEHSWRNVLQDQLGRHYLRVVLGLKDEPKEKKPEVKLVKIRGEGGKVA